jgi:predicted enzyme related to lactoylglutathione lyase
MPTLLYTETALESVERAEKFYDDLFGSPDRYVSKLNEGLGNQHYYWVVTAVDDRGNRALGGSGLQGYCGIALLKGITVYVDVLQNVVPSIDQYITRVGQLGGAVITPKRSVPGMGSYAICRDTANNSFAIWETDSTITGPSILDILCG